MKRIYIALVLLAVIGASCIATLSLEKHQLQAMIDLTNRIETSCREENYAQAMTDVETLKREFGNRTDTFALFLRHNELKTIEELVLVLPMYLEQRDLHPFYVDLARCRFLLQKQYEMDLPTLQNIF